MSAPSPMADARGAARWRRGVVMMGASVLVLAVICVVGSFSNGGQGDSELEMKMKNECDLYGCHTVEVKPHTSKSLGRVADKDVLSQLNKLAHALAQAHKAGSAEVSKTHSLKQKMRSLEENTASDASKLQDTRDILHQEEREEEDEHIARLKAQDQLQQQRKELNQMATKVRSEEEDERVALRDMSRDRAAIDSDGTVLAETKKTLLREKHSQADEHAKLVKAEAQLDILREHSQHEEGIIALQNKIIKIQAHDIDSLEHSARNAMAGVQAALGSELKSKKPDSDLPDKWEKKMQRMDDIRQKQLDAAHDWARRRERPDMDEMTAQQEAADKALAGKQARWEKKSSAAAAEVQAKFEKREDKMQDIRRRQLDAAHDWAKRRESIGDPSDAETEASDSYASKQRKWMKAHPEAVGSATQAGTAPATGSMPAGLGSGRSQLETGAGGQTSAEGEGLQQEATSGQKEAKAGKEGADGKGVRGAVGADIASLKGLLEKREMSGGEGKVIAGALGQAERELKKLAVASEELNKGAQAHAGAEVGAAAGTGVEGEQQEAPAAPGGAAEAREHAAGQHPAAAPQQAMKARAQSLAGVRLGQQRKEEGGAGDDEFEVQVPRGAKGGEDMQVHMPGGRVASVELPANVKAGTDVILLDADSAAAPGEQHEGRP